MVKYDLEGKRFGILTVLEFDTVKTLGNGKRVAMWKCQCDCGNIKSVSRGHLTHGHTKSCGCLEKKQQAAFKTINLTHGMTKTKAYRTWCFIKNRCYNKRDKNYQHYGAKGIRLSYEWEYDPKSFCEYVMALDGYDDPKKSLDRIDGTKGYCEGNLRWATVIEQQNNKCNNHFVTIDGVKKSISRWAAENGLDHRTVYCRIERGWPLELAVSLPVRTEIKEYMEEHQYAD